MPRDRRQVERGLTNKGFAETQGDHHFFTYVTFAGKKTRVFTKTSHGAKQIDDKTLSMMARQCRLGRGEFFRLVDCPMTQDEYEAHLKTLGLV